MGHIVFLAMHVLALLFGAVMLFVTIPAHLIYSAFSGGGAKRDPEAPRPDTHVRCPQCRELVRKDASLCKHCRCSLIPQS